MVRWAESNTAYPYQYQISKQLNLTFQGGRQEETRLEDKIQLNKKVMIYLRLEIFIVRLKWTCVS